MDSNAFNILLLPVCLGACLGLLAGSLIRLALAGLSCRIDRTASTPSSCEGQVRVRAGMNPIR